MKRLRARCRGKGGSGRAGSVNVRECGANASLNFGAPAVQACANQSNGAVGLDKWTSGSLSGGGPSFRCSSRAPAIGLTTSHSIGGLPQWHSPVQCPAPSALENDVPTSMPSSRRCPEQGQSQTILWEIFRTIGGGYI